MRFSEVGPEFPPELIEQLIAGEVVFLCGAGVSAPQLPGFRRLVDDIYGMLGEERTAGEEAAYVEQRFEECLGSLSRRLSRPEDLIDATAEILKIQKFKRSSNHETILRISRDEDGRPSIVTTNFDTLFERAWVNLPNRGPALRASTAGQEIPAPGTERFHGIIHLHGRLLDTRLKLPATDLILTSAQYGEAYLRAGWAARFFFDLARCRTLVLVGYSASDAPVRYILNVLEADRNRFTDLKTVYAFDKIHDDNESAVAARWEALAVVPLLYKHQADRSGNTHGALWSDLGALANLVEQPEESRRSAIREIASRQVTGTSEAERQKVQWAMRSRPDLAGLLVETVTDPAWFNVIKAELDAAGPNATAWTLSRWFERGWDSRATWNFALSVADEMNERLAKELDQALWINPPQHAPWSKAWRLLSQSAKRHRERFRLHGFQRSLAREPHEADLLEVAHAIAPKLRVREPSLSDLDHEDEQATELADIGTFRLDSDSDLPVHPIIQALEQRPATAGRLCQLASEELIRALMVARDAELIQGKRDATDWTVPSVAAHEQNRHHGGFTPLIRLISGLFGQWALHDPRGAKALAEGWRHAGFRLTMRLWLHALTTPNLFTADEAVGALLDLQHEGFWSVRREGPLLIRLRSSDARPDLRLRLAERVVTEGGRLYTDGDQGPDDGWQSRARDREIWLRLKLLSETGDLPDRAASILREIEDRQPHLRREVEDTDFFAIYSTGVRSVRPNSGPLVAAAPEQRLQVAERLEESSDIEDRESWAEYCRIDMDGALQSLTSVAVSVDILRRWRDWLNVIPFSPSTLDAVQKDQIRVLVEQAFSHLTQTDTATVAQLGSPLAEAYIRASELGAKIASNWWDRLWAGAELATAPEHHGERNLYDEVINSAGGRLAEFLLKKIDRDRRKKRKQANRDTRRLERLLSSDSFSGLMGRGACARHLGFVFSIAPNLVENLLLPLLTGSDAQSSKLRAVAVEHNRFSPAATAVLREAILRGVSESTAEGVAASNVASQTIRPVLGRLAKPEGASWGISDEAVRQTLRAASPSIRTGAIDVLQRWLVEEPQSERAQKWSELYGPAFRIVWPKDRKYRSQSATQNILELALSSGDSFPSAVHLLTPYMLPLQADWLDLHMFTQDDYYVVRSFPEESLRLLWACCKPPCSGRSTEMGRILDVLVERAPSLGVDRRVQRLRMRSVT